MISLFRPTPRERSRCQINQERSRCQINEVVRKIIQRAAEWMTLDKQGRRLLEDQKRLERQFADFERYRGRQIPTSALLLMLPFFSFTMDFVIVSPITEFLVGWTGASSTWLLPARVLVSGSYVLLGYAIGSALHDWQTVREQPFLGLLAVLYFVALPLLVLGYIWLQPDLPRPTGYGLTAFALVNSAIPLVFGRASSEAREYLFYLFVQRHDRRLERIRREKDEIGANLVALFHNAMTAVAEHERQFGERVELALTDDARDLIQRYSQQGIRINLHGDEPTALPAPAPANPPDESTTLSVPAPPSGDGHDENSAVADYLRQQLESAAHSYDGALRNPDFNLQLR